jgi:ribonuclease HI
MIFQDNLPTMVEETLFCQEPQLETTEKIAGEEEVSRQRETDGFHSQMWTLYFNGSKSQEGSGAGCILIDPKGKQNFMSCTLEFEYTNYTTEYEALVQGLKKSIDLNIKELKVFVRNTIHCNSPHLRNYQQEVHKLKEHFEAFNITAIPRTKNTLVDSMSTASSRLSSLEDYEASQFTVELLYKPSVPNNISNWKVFEGDEQIINFLTNRDNFKDLAIDDEVFQEQLAETDPRIDQLNDKPRSHMIPKGVANLENLFDPRERFKGSKNAKNCYRRIPLRTSGFPLGC